MVHFALQGLVLLAAMLVFRRPPDLEYLPVLLLAFVVTLVLCTALAIALAAVVVWGASILLFGFGGLIVPALLLVLLTFVVIITISRG